MQKAKLKIAFALTLVLGLWTLDGSAQTIVNVNLWNLISQNVTNRKTLLSPIDGTLVAPAGHLPDYDPFPGITDGNGNLVMTNVLEGFYTFRVLGPPRDYSWVVYVPTNAVTNLSLDMLVVVPTNQTYAPGNQAYPINVANNLFIRFLGLFAGPNIVIATNTNTVPWTLTISATGGGGTAFTNDASQFATNGTITSMANGAPVTNLVVTGEQLNGPVLNEPLWIVKSLGAHVVTNSTTNSELPGMAFTSAGVGNTPGWAFPAASNVTGLGTMATNAATNFVPVSTLYYAAWKWPGVVHDGVTDDAAALRTMFLDYTNHPVATAIYDFGLSYTNALSGPVTNYVTNAVVEYFNLVPTSGANSVGMLVNAGADFASIGPGTIYGTTNATVGSFGIYLAGEDSVANYVPLVSVHGVKEAQFWQGLVMSNQMHSDIHDNAFFANGSNSIYFVASDDIHIHDDDVGVQLWTVNNGWERASAASWKSNCIEIEGHGSLIGQPSKGLNLDHINGGISFMAGYFVDVTQINARYWQGESYFGPTNVPVVVISNSSSVNQTWFDLESLNIAYAAAIGGDPNRNVLGIYGDAEATASLAINLEPYSGGGFPVFDIWTTNGSASPPLFTGNQQWTVHTTFGDAGVVNQINQANGPLPQGNFASLSYINSFNGQQFIHNNISVDGASATFNAIQITNILTFGNARLQQSGSGVALLNTGGGGFLANSLGNLANEFGWDEAGNATAYGSLKDNGLTASTAVYADSSKTLQSSSTTTAELADLHNVGGPINTTYLPIASPTFTGTLTGPTANVTALNAGNLITTNAVVVQAQHWTIVNYIPTTNDYAIFTRTNIGIYMTNTYPAGQEFLVVNKSQGMPTVNAPAGAVLTSIYGTNTSVTLGPWGSTSNTLPLHWDGTNF